MHIFILAFVFIVLVLWGLIIEYKALARLKNITAQDTDNYLCFFGQRLKYSYFKKQIKNGFLQDEILVFYYKQFRVIDALVYMVLTLFIIIIFIEL